MEQKEFKDHLLNALISFFYNLFYLVVIMPFDLWKKATIRLSEQRDAGKLDVDKISGILPFFRFLKNFIFEFLIDGIIFIAYIAGPIIAFIKLFTSRYNKLEVFIGVILVAYFYPVVLSFFRDYLQLLIMPVKKFLSWVSKPAQYMDLTIDNKK